MATDFGAVVVVEGIEDLQRSLRAYDALLPRRLRLVGLAAADVVVAHERELAPVGGADKSLRDLHPGRLRDAIKAKAQQRSAQAVLPIDDNTPYAGVVNFGWPLRHIRQQEFMYRGARESEDRVVAIYDAGVGELIHEAGL